MILQGAPTGEGLEQTKVYLVSPEGVVSPLRLAPGVWLGWNSQGDFPPPPGEGASSRVINDNGQYAGTLNISEDPVEFVATRNGNPLPGGAGTYPMAINNNGWVSAYGGIIWDPNGNRTDIREVLVNQLSDSPFINSSLLYSGGNTFINDQLDVVFSGFYITHAETGIIFDALSGDLEIIDQKLIAYVGSRITIDTSVLNYGRGYFKNAKIVTQPESDLFRLISGPTPALPPAIGENEKIESVLIYDIVKPGIYSGHFAVVGNDGRGPIEEPGFDFTLHYIVPDLGMRMNASPLELAESETINLRMTITNHSDQPVNNIQLDGAITTEGSGEVVLIEDPVAPVIPSLQPGAEVDLVYSYKADFPGQVFFRGRVKGQKESGELTISPSTVSNEIKIVPPVEISIRAKPFVGEGDNALPIVNMELDEEGNIRNEDGNIIVPKVEVTFENLGEKNVLILLQAITPFARDRTPLVDRIDVFQGSGLSQNPNQEFPFDMGTLGPGERKSIEYPLIIRKDGRFEFRAFATGRYEERPGQFNLIVQDAPIGVGQKYPLEIEIKLADQLNQVVGVGNGSHKIPPGSRVTVLGTLRNRTSNMKIQVNAIDAMATRNAFGGVITDQTLAGGNPMPGTDVLAPFTIDQELTPGQSIVLQGIIITDPNGAPSGTVTWELPEDGVLIDLQTQEEKDLEKEDILLKSEIGGWDSDPLTMRLIQDNSRPPLPPLEWWEPAKHYTEGVMYGIGSWTYNTLDSVGAIGRGAGTASNYIDSAEDIVDLMGQGGLALLHAGEYVKNTWEEMTAEQVEQFLLVVAKEVQRRGQLSFKDKVVEDIENLNSVLAVVREKTLPLFNNVADVYASDDPRQIAELWGEVSGNVIAEVATSFVPSPKFTRYAE
ncbi:MAG: hypothetical protein KJT03_14100, partial [Verrucomicrobiae bacterium]|nr:hypothetical protein [Verrucomicrobiae bacterium]